MAAPHGDDAGEQPSRLLILGVVAFYMLAAILMVTVNKWVLLSSQLPVFFIFCQLAIAVLLLWACRVLRLLAIPHFERTTALRLAPLTLVSVLGFIFNNLCIQYVDASFYQVARGLILPMTVGLTFMTNLTPPSSRCLACCVVITMGFLLGVTFDQFSIRSVYSSSAGVVFGVLSSLTTALHSVVVRKSLPVVGNSAIALAWYSNLLTAVALLPFVFVMGETRPIAEMIFSATQLRTFVWGSIVTGVFGFLISIAGLLSLKFTSPVTHMVSSALRSVIQTLLSIWAFGDIVTYSRATSIFIIILGSCMYVWNKHVEQQEGGEQPRRQSLHKKSRSEVTGSPTRFPLTRSFGLTGSSREKEKA